MSEPSILNVSDLGGEASNNGRVITLPEVSYDGRKWVLPDTPDTRDRAALAAWATAVFRLDPQRPIVRGHHYGERGGGGIAVLERYDAPSLRFDPASSAGKPDTLVETLTWQRARTDREPIAWLKPQAKTIGFVVSALCEREADAKQRHPADVVVTTLIHTARRIVDFTTYGTSGQRFEAGRVLAPELDEHGRLVRMRYLVDSNSGELVLRVSDAQQVARHLLGSLRRGYLDGVFQEYGWQRVTLDGHGLAEGGRAGPHHRSDVYRGRLPESPADEAATT